MNTYNVSVVINLEANSEDEAEEIVTEILNAEFDSWSLDTIDED